MYSVIRFHTVRKAQRRVGLAVVQSLKQSDRSIRELDQIWPLYRKPSLAVDILLRPTIPATASELSQTILSWSQRAMRLAASMPMLVCIQLRPTRVLHTPKPVSPQPAEF